jgi:hypothetical protein
VKQRNPSTNNNSFETTTTTATTIANNMPNPGMHLSRNGVVCQEMSSNPYVPSHQMSKAKHNNNNYINNNNTNSDKPSLAGPTAALNLQ